MNIIFYIFIILLLGIGIALIYMAPGMLTIGFSVIMLLVVAAGIYAGILPVLRYFAGLTYGLISIKKTESIQADSSWEAISNMESVFREKTLDSIFIEYKNKIRVQKRTGQILSDMEDYLNEDTLAARSWQNVIAQVSGTLTGLGILGTFIGLIQGLSDVEFGTIATALTSVQTLLGGIETAFYTSLAGVILSILFNIMHRISWNMMTRQLERFLDEFHHKIIPTVEEQSRYREKKELQKITVLLQDIKEIQEGKINEST